MINTYKIGVIYIEMDSKTKVWYVSMISAMLVNGLLLGFVTASSQQCDLIDILMLVCVVLYFVGTFYRCLLPRIDLERVVLFDHYGSSVVAGRYAATIAELAYIMQITLMIWYLSSDKTDLFTMSVVIAVPLLIILAEVFSWYGVIMRNNLGSCIEESIWTLAFILILTWSILQYKQDKEGVYVLLSAGISFYILFMLVIDIPLYIRRHLKEKPDVRKEKGLSDAFHRRVRRREWPAWREDAPWMSLYFSFAVLSSIGLFAFYVSKQRSTS